MSASFALDRRYASRRCRPRLEPRSACPEARGVVPKSRPTSRNGADSCASGKIIFEAACPGVAPVGLVVAALALFLVAPTAHADGRASGIRILDVDFVQSDVIGTRNDCWDGAPMDARVRCAPPWPEHDGLTVQVTLDRATTSPTVIRYQSMDLTATAGTDYVVLDSTVTVPAGDLKATFRIPFIDDLVEEGNEEFVVEITPPAGVDVLVDYLHMTIIDEESIKISVVDASFDESLGEVQVSVMYSDWVFWPVRMKVETADGTAIAPGDYLVVDEVVRLPNFPVPNTGLTVRIGAIGGALAVSLLRYTTFSSPHDIIDDALDEPDETFTVTISGRRYLSTDSDTGTVTILDNDDPPSVSIADVSGLEDSVDKLSFAVTLDAPSGQEVTLDYATKDHDATMGVDYDHAAGSLTFAPGEVEKTVDVTVKPDDVHEADETFGVTLQDAHNVTLGDPDAIGTIVDDDAELSISDAFGREADPMIDPIFHSRGEMGFVVEAKGLTKPNQTVTVDYATEDGTATAPGDYGSKSGTLTFTSTDSEQVITVSLVDDTVVEPDETLFVNLSNPINATLGDRQAVGTLIDNDVASTEVTLAAVPERVWESSGATPVTVTATLDNAARTEATEVTVSVAGSGNADAVDFQDVPSFTITIAAGEVSGTGTFTLAPEDDNVDEEDETLTVTGASDLPVEETEVELRDDDSTSSNIALTATPPRVSEGDGATPVEVTATLDAGTRTQATAVTVTVSGSGNDAAVDFADVEAFTITIAAGEVSGTGTFMLAPEDDNVDEEDETLTVTGASDLPVEETEVELRDDDSTSSNIALTATPPRVSEGDGATPVEVTATLDAGTRTQATAVTVTVSGSGNDAAVDFADVEAFTITIAAGEVSGTGTFMLAPEDDNVDEEDETLTVTGASDLPVEETEVELRDDDSTSSNIALTATPPRVSEGDGATPVEVTATLDAGTRTQATAVTVTVSGSGNDAAVDFADVEAFTITIAAGEVSGTGTFMLAPEDDNVDEEHETLTVTGASDLPVEETEVELRDDDSTSSNIALTATPPRVSEGDGATPVEVTATLDAGTRTQATAVTVTVSGSGNDAAVDFADVEAFTITIAAGEVSGTGTFMLAPEDDNVDEEDETLTVTGASDLPVKEDTVELTDNDQPSADIALAASPSRIAENGGARDVRVTAALGAGARTEATSIRVTITDSGQSDAVDYTGTAAEFDITIAAGATSGTGTYRVTPEDDRIDERDEILDIKGTSVLPVVPASVTLTDDEETSTEIVLAAVPSTVSEGAGATEVVVTATVDAGARTVETTVAVAVTGSGDAGAVDFAAVPDFTITIAAGSIRGRGTFTLTPDDDDVAESSETLEVDGTSDMAVRETSVTITDDDVASDAITLSASPALVSEGGGAVPVTVTASLNGAARQAATTVTVSVAGSGDAQAVDFQAVADFTIIISATAADGTGTFTLTPENDAIAEEDETLAVSGTSELPVTSTTVTLADDDEASTRILLSAVPGRVSEGDGATPVTVTASLDRARRQRATTVTVSVSGSGDPDATDFAAVPDFAITIAANAASGGGTFTLTPEDDALVEANEHLMVTGISDLPVTQAEVTLADNDEVSTRILVYLAVDPPRASEGDGEVRVTVTAAVDKSVRAQESSITVSVAGSGDPDAVDFEPVPDFEIVIPANVPTGTATFTVVPEDDLVVEANEVLTVSGVSDLPVTPATMELLDDDEVSGILLSADPARVSEGGGPVAVTVTASLDGGVRRQATRVAVSVARSGDPDAVDFEAVSDFEITIDANAPSGTGMFTLTPEDDAEDEADETLTLTGDSDLPVTSASVVLVDDDEIRVLSVADANAAEAAGEVVFTVVLDGPSGAQATVAYATANPVAAVDPIAEANIDYESVAGMLTFAPGEVSRMIRVPVLDDDQAEPDETFAFVLSDPRGAALSRGTALGTIRNDDEPPTLAIADASGSEGDGELRFAVTLSASAPTATTVNYASIDGTAAAGSDYEAVEGILTFGPGETMNTITVLLIDDTLDEADEESFALALSAPTGATLDTASGSGTIRDDDEPPTVSVADAAGDEGVGALDFALTLNAASGIEASLSYATADGTATAGSDYTAASGTLVFAPGETSATIRVAIIDDDLDEADAETFSLALSGLENAAAADVSATGTIRDNDMAPPSLAGQLPAVVLCVGGTPYELDLAGYFEGEELAFSAVSAAPGVATAALEGSRLTVAPASEGETTVSVTATNSVGSVSGMINVRVVTDPAELEAVEAVLASIGRGILTSVTESVRARVREQSAFAWQGAVGQQTTFGELGASRPRNAFDERSGSMSASANRPRPTSGTAIAWNRWPGTGAQSIGSDRTQLPVPEVLGGRGPTTTNRPGMVPFSLSLDSPGSALSGPAWTVWARGDAQRFESGVNGSSHDGSLTAVHLGADARVGEWLAGVSLSRASAEADYRFVRSVDACGEGAGVGAGVGAGEGAGKGMVDAELTSVHPYAGRRVGRGWVWATVGAGAGESSVERCETGRREEADLSMRLAALGGRHPFAGGERMAVSVVEEIGILNLTTGDAADPVGEHDVTVGQARLGLELARIAQPESKRSLATFLRAFARGDWGDGATGTGMELAAGVRYRNLPRRLGIDAGVRTLVAHSAEDAAERSGDLTLSVLPRADGSGLTASFTWRRQANDIRLGGLDGPSWWTPPEAHTSDTKRHWTAATRLAYGVALGRSSSGTPGMAVPFVEFDAGNAGRGGGRLGVRHEFGGFVVEWGVDRMDSRWAGRERFVLTAAGSF